MWRITASPCATMTRVRPNRCLRSSSRLTICACTETSRAETGSSPRIRRGLRGERAGDADALALAAGELVRVAPRLLGRQPHRPQQVGDAGLPLAAAHGRVQPDRLADDRLHAHARVERGERVLEDDLQVAADRRSSPGARVARSRPSYITAPAVGAISLSSRRPSVDLPEPDSPTSASVSPRRDRERHAVHRLHRRRRPPEQAAALAEVFGEALASRMGVERRSATTASHGQAGDVLLQRRADAGDGWPGVRSRSGGRASRQAAGQRGSGWRSGSPPASRPGWAPARRWSARRPWRGPFDRHRTHQADRVGVLGVVEQRRHRPALDDAPGVHHRHVVGDLRHHAEVVGDEDHAVPASACSSRSRARICAWMVTSSAVVGSSAMSRAGALASAMAIITRCRRPPESSCG